MNSEKDRSQPYRSPAQQVAEACAANDVAILIPCHRVIRSDGSSGGYRWGAGRKKTLLAKERMATEASLFELRYYPLSTHCGDWDQRDVG